MCKCTSICNMGNSLILQYYVLISAYCVILQVVQNGVESNVQGGENLLE